MYSLYDLIIISLSLLVVGLIIGYMSAQKRAPSVQAQRKLEEHLEKLEHQQEDYQHQVTEHFSETAELLNQLTDSYRDVHNHLAKGAQLLAGEQASGQLQHIHDDDETAPQLDELKAAEMAPPLDYAPKSGPHDKGVLNEEFGLEKAKNTDEDNNGADQNQKAAG